MASLAFFYGSILRITGGLLSRARNLKYSILGVHLEGYVWLRSISIPRQWSDINLEAGVALESGVTLICSGTARPGKLGIGARTYINRNTILDASESLIIGEDCMIGPGCYLTDHDHGVEPEQAPGGRDLISRPTRIGARVWIGAHAVVLKGVRIGDDAVIAAGAVVTRDVAPRSRVAGIPARPITTSSPPIPR